MVGSCLKLIQIFNSCEVLIAESLKREWFCSITVRLILKKAEEIMMHEVMI